MGLNNFILTCEKDNEELRKDINYYKNLTSRLKKENQELKKQLEEINKMIEKCGFVNIEQVMLNYCGLLSQQKEFIKYLEDKIKKEKDDLEKLCELYKIPKENNAAYKFAYSYINKMEEILQKYKEIIGVEDEKK